MPRSVASPVAAPSPPYRRTAPFCWPRPLAQAQNAHQVPARLALRRARPRCSWPRRPRATSRPPGSDVTIDAGNGSGGTVTRVASGSYDMGFADLAALMEFHANNPDAPNKPVAVMMVYNNTPAAVLALKKSGIKTPADLNGKKLGAPVFDAGRKAFPIFAKANNVSGVDWTSMDPPLRETMLVRGDIDAITGFSFTSMLNLEARGVKAEEIVVLPYPQYGVKLYGNVIIVGEEFLKKNPDAVKAFLQGLQQGHEGRGRRPEGRDRHREGARRHHQRRARTAPAEAGARRHRADARRQGRGLRQMRWRRA